MSTEQPVVVTPKSYDEHLAYLHGIVRLKLHFLWRWLNAHPEEEFTHALRERVDIYRKTDVNPEGINPAQMRWDDPRWAAMEDEVAALYRTHRADSTADTFEERAFVVFAASVTARAPRDFLDRSGLDGYDYGSIRIEPPAAQSTRIGIHIANAVAPRSIFDDPAYLPSCLREVMRRAEAEYGADSLATFTWLNAVPKWLALFPREWQEQLEPPSQNILWHYGYWGQFINARGTLNARLAQQLRATGSLPYLPRNSWCSFAALREHLRNSEDIQASLSLIHSINPTP